MTRTLSILSIIFSSFALCFAFLSFKNPSSESSFASMLHSRFRACIDYNENIPEKKAILDLLTAIEKNHCAFETGNDDLRIKFVNLQGCVEHVLACAQALGEITDLVGVIHTPTVATPLCVLPDEPISDGILDESIRYDLNKLLTVRSRAQIVREYLIKGGRLYVTYPENGLKKRTPEQLQIYHSELATFPHNLFDWLLNCDEINPDMIGATYLLRNKERELFAFSIKSRQANDIQRSAEWGIWFGSLNDAIVSKRVNEIFDYLNECDGPDIRTEI